MSKKTEFEELWSKIRYTETYEKDKILLWYTHNGKLKDTDYWEVDQLKQISKTLLNIGRYNEGGNYESVEIPTRNIYVITYKYNIIFDRRDGYKGNADLTLPPLRELFNFDCRDGCCNQNEEDCVW